MDFTSLSFIRLSPTHPLKPFDCGDSDLTEFFNNDCKNYLKDLLAVTYVLENEDETIAFFSLLNDKITATDVDRGKWKKMRKHLPRRKQFKSYPAMKIGRLGVHNSHKKQGYGTAILDYLKVLFVSNNRTGCKYITVDAYRQSLIFYENNGFNYLTETDVDADTRVMYFDLALIQNVVHAGGPANPQANH